MTCDVGKRFSIVSKNSIKCSNPNVAISILLDSTSDSFWTGGSDCICGFGLDTISRKVSFVLSFARGEKDKQEEQGICVFHHFLTFSIEEFQCMIHNVFAGWRRGRPAV